MPNVVGLNAADARQVGERLGLFVRGPDPDSPPVAEIGWPDGVVVDQYPEPGAHVALGSTLILWIERGPGSAGVREPRRPSPDPKVLHGEADEPSAD